MLTAAIIIICLTCFLIAAYFITPHIGERWVREQKKTRGTARGRLYEKLYGLPWGSVTTNNYGFAPAETGGPERFQLQMYKELSKLLTEERGAPLPGSTLLEVSCGRGGGLVSLIQSWPNAALAVGLDYSENALKFCRKTYRSIPNLVFVRASALQLPFTAGSFDVILNVEASHNYGDDLAFFREVHRLLRTGGAFLYADYRRPHLVGVLEAQLKEAGLRGELRNITRNVAEACRLDSSRRSTLIRESLPWYYRLLFSRQIANYGAVEGSRKYEAFQTDQRLYFVTCALKVG